MKKTWMEKKIREEKKQLTRLTCTYVSPENIRTAFSATS